MWPFRRKPTGRPPLNEDWRAGDLAICLKNCRIGAPSKQPRRGARALVLQVHPGWSGAELGWGLALAGYPGLSGRSVLATPAAIRDW